MKKVLVCAYLEFNLGDDLFLKIIFEKYPNVNFVIFNCDKKYKKLFRNYKNVRIENSLILKIFKEFGLKSIIKKLQNYDILLYIGGSIFMQFNHWKKQFKNRKNIIDLFSYNKKPIFIIGANFGPFYEKTFVNLYKKEFKKCTDICFRDTYSYNLFKDLNNVRVEPDVIFQLKTKSVKKIKKSIGISIINLKNRDNLKTYQQIYNLKIKEIIEKAISKNNIVKLFCFCEREGDMIAIKDIIKILDKRYYKNISIVNYSGNINEFLLQFKQMENIIGSRFHACILSQVFDQGLYPIIYSDKIYNVLKDIDMLHEYTYIKNLKDLNVEHIFKVISQNKIKNYDVFKKSENQFIEFNKYVHDD
ncbi:polysaccharide pyruvyl transferase family protein [uncultured Clostridium sp.]|uniref:polysaccharide pyruvyl transferase family protein n=1 Tax=uncultured Clostridium sp. TaxID=59620 RepID=UPI0025EC0B9C|nr:polysaccharide pyruvyl transferase family protein [uncultured Clostridium sp.]